MDHLALLALLGADVAARGLPVHAARGGRRPWIAPTPRPAPAIMPAPPPCTSGWRPKPPAATAWNSVCAPRAPGWPRVAPPMPIGCWRRSARALTQQQALEQRLLRIQSAVAAGSRRRSLARSQRHAGADGAGRGRKLLRNPPAGGHRHRPPGRWHPRRTRRANASSRPATHASARSELLAQLRAAAERGVSLTPPPGSDATVRGWLEAASVAADNARNPTLGATRLAAFRARYPSHPALAALAGEPGIGIEEPPATLEAAPHLALILPLTGRTADVLGADPRRLHDGLLPAAGDCAPAAAGLRQRHDVDRRHHGARPRRPAPSSSSAR